MDYPDFYVCEEMQKLRAALDEAGIKWEDKSSHASLWNCRTRINTEDGEWWSVIHGFGTYGGYASFIPDRGLLEIYGSKMVEPVGWLTAEGCMAIMRGEMP